MTDTRYLDERAAHMQAVRELLDANRCLRHQRNMALALLCVVAFVILTVALLGGHA